MMHCKRKLTKVQTPAQPCISSFFTGLCTLPDPYLFHDQPLIQPTHSSVSTTHNWWDYQFYLYFEQSFSYIFSSPSLSSWSWPNFPGNVSFSPSCYCLFCKQKINLNCGEKYKTDINNILAWRKRRSKTVKVTLFKLQSPLTPFFL